MANVSRDLDFLISSIVPQARDDDVLRDDLLAHCEDILRRFDRDRPILLRAPGSDDIATVTSGKTTNQIWVI